MMGRKAVRKERIKRILKKSQSKEKRKEKQGKRKLKLVEKVDKQIQVLKLNNGVLILGLGIYRQANPLLLKSNLKEKDKNYLKIS